MTELRLRPVLDRALEEKAISPEDLETVLELATREEVVVINGEKDAFECLISLLEGGEIAVEGIPHREILSRLSIFA